MLSKLKCCNYYTKQLLVVVRYLTLNSHLGSLTNVLFCGLNSMFGNGNYTQCVQFCFFCVYGTSIKFIRHLCSVSPNEVVKSTSLSLCPCSVCVIVINQNCQKWGHFRADVPFFEADASFFAAGSFLPYFICIWYLPVM